MRMYDEGRLKEQYDIGLVYRSNHNYGANMTHYALCSFLKSKGYSVLMIDLFKNSCLSLPIDRDDPFELYLKNPYSYLADIIEPENEWDYIELNNICSIFLVGSDQLWRNYFLTSTNYYSTLDWTDDNKYRISYATSFGSEIFEGNSKETAELAERLERFQYISVREQSGVDICKNIFGRTATCVIDPVFLCDKSVYVSLMDSVVNSRVPRRAYLGEYILDMDEYKVKIAKKVMKEIKSNNYALIGDAMVKFDPLDGARVEEWLEMIYKSEFLVTDSFHGTCFAIIFHKQFITIFEKKNHRGYTRIESLLGMLGLKERLINAENECNLLEIVNRKIDYQNVDIRINAYKYESIEWFENALKEMQENYISADKSEMSKYALNLLHKKENYEIKKKKLHESLSKCAGKSERFIIWGTGSCFARIIRLVTEIIDVDTVIDSDRNKWGKIYLNKIICKSPEVLMNEKDVVVLVLVEKEELISEICKTLGEYGISKIITYSQIFEAYDKAEIGDKK